MSMHDASAAQGDAAAVKSAPSDSGSCSKGIYVLDQQLIAVTQLRGKLLHRMGIQRGGTLYLRPEEALYLMEKDLLVIEIPSVSHTAAASVTELKHLMEVAGIALREYAVYKELMDASLIVTRHPAQWLGKQVDQAFPAERPAKQKSIAKEVPLPYKRQKIEHSAALARQGPAEGGLDQIKQSSRWPLVEPMPQRSHNPEDSVQGAEASSSRACCFSIGEWRLPARPSLQPLRRCPPAPKSSTVEHQPAMVYDVYRGNSCFSRKKPSCLLTQVHMSQSRPPSRDVMCAAEAACQGDAAVYHATAAGTHVSMYSFQRVCLPDLFRDDPPQQG